MVALDGSLQSGVSAVRQEQPTVEKGIDALADDACLCPDFGDCTTAASGKRGTNIVACTICMFGCWR